MTPRKGFTGFRNSRSFNPERMLRPRKNPAMTAVFTIESRHNRYVNADTR